MLPEAVSTGLAVVVSGETVEDAVAIGLSRLNLPRSHVSVEVIERGRKGGFFRRNINAVVRLTPTEDIDGALGIFDGQVKVRAPLGPGRPARIIPGHGIEVTVDGVRQSGPSTVLPHQTVALTITAHLTQKDRFVLEVAPDAMSVALRVAPLGSYRIADAPYAAELTPHLSLALGTSVTVEEVEEALVERGVRFGVDRKAIADALNRADGQVTVVAWGTPMTPGRDACLRWLVQADRPEHAPDERVNHLERSGPLTVEEGTALAVVEPLVEGKPGRNVFGEKLLPPPVNEYRVVTGPGARLEEDSVTVVAVSAGRPVEARRSRYSVVRVLPVYEHMGHVDRSTGNLHVRGDLVVTGDVAHSMEVTATGNITILGQVSQATVKARGSITVLGNCIASTLVSGETQAFFKSVVPRLAELDEMLSSIIGVVGEVMKAPGFKTEELERQGLGPLLQMLVERRFSNLLSVSRSVADLVAELDDSGDDLIKLLTQVLSSRLLGGRLFEVRSLSELVDAKYLLSRVRETMAVDGDLTGDITLPYCEQSTVRSQGSIRVTGKGSYRSRLVARNRIEVREAVVGGRLRTGESIEVGRVGSELGVLTHLEVAATGSICARTAFPNTQIQVGRLQEVVHDQRPIRAKLEGQGRLKVIR